MELAIEATLGRLAASLRDVKARIPPLFTQDRVHERQVCYSAATTLRRLDARL